MRTGDGVHTAEHLRIFVGPASEVHEAIDGDGDFAFGFGCVRAGGAGDFVNEFGRAVLEHFCGAIKDLAAVVGAGFGPAINSGTSGDDGVAEVFAGGVGEIIKVFAARGFGGKITAAFAAREFAADVEFVGFANVQPAHGLILEGAGRIGNGFPKPAADGFQRYLDSLSRKEGRLAISDCRIGRGEAHVNLKSSIVKDLVG